MFEPQFEIEIYTLQNRDAYHSKAKDLSFQNLHEFLLISKIYDEFTMALCRFGKLRSLAFEWYASRLCSVYISISN
jgi:hypothetical protein